MPNWCDNSLEITGPDESIKKLITFVGRPFSKTNKDGTIEKYEDHVFAFENILPSTHDTSSVMFPSSGPDDWWSNNVNSWGTKWDIADSDSASRSIQHGAVYYGFNTAWSPPSPVISRLAEVFPELKITHSYSETGMDFWGIDIYENGVLASDEGGELDHSAWKTLGQDCWNCSENDDPEYWYSDCPPAIELAKKKKEKKKKKKVSA